jgi:hypothetical protein
MLSRLDPGVSDQARRRFSCVTLERCEMRPPGALRGLELLEWIHRDSLSDCLGSSHLVLLIPDPLHDRLEHRVPLRAR